MPRAAPHTPEASAASCGPPGHAARQVVQGPILQMRKTRTRKQTVTILKLSGLPIVAQTLDGRGPQKVPPSPRSAPGQQWNSAGDLEQVKRPGKQLCRLAPNAFPSLPSVDI